jgi:hypothetical protein
MLLKNGYLGYLVKLKVFLDGTVYWGIQQKDFEILEDVL